MKKRVFKHFNEVDAELEPEKVTLPPIFGVAEYEKGTFEARNCPFSLVMPYFGAQRWRLGLKRPYFGAKGAENELRPGSGQRVENVVIWVKKSTFRKWTQNEVFEVGEPEKRVFKSF